MNSIFNVVTYGTAVIITGAVAIPVWFIWLLYNCIESIWNRLDKRYPK